MDALVVDEVNEYSVQMLGARDRCDFAGSVTRYWAPSPDTFRRAMEARYRGGVGFEEETKILTHDGRVINVLFKAARPGQAPDPATSLIGLIDISDRVRTQEMLQRVQADFAHAARVSMLGELTASIAHEVNPEAHFKFVAHKGYKPQPGELRFGMFEAEFTHKGDCCSFEVLLDRIGLIDPALKAIAEIVHDIDLKDGKFARPETAGIARLITGVAVPGNTDEERIERGSAIFEDLYASFREGRA